NALYVTGGRVVIIEEPKLRKSDAQKFVPETFREKASMRYNLYIAGQSAWDDTPTYILDEWVAYVNGARVGIDDVQKGRYKDTWVDGVAGSLEFTVFSMALCMA